MLKTSTVLAATTAVLIAASAQAGTHKARGTGPIYQKVVHSTNGKPVVDSFGNCVLTNFKSSHGDDCGYVSLDVELRTVYFAFNGSSLSPAAKSKLNTLAGALKSKKVKAIKVVGYADEIGTDSYNQRLSARRANAVAAYLKAKGIVVKGKAEVRGLGETASKSECGSVSGNELKACLWRDRRVEVEVVN
jgi:outer membrane protein OmpA-like peptidoglycan-associated protein